MSAHTIYRNISNLENALKVYRPAEYVALETGTLAMNPVEAAQALNHEMPELTAGSGIPALAPAHRGNRAGNGRGTTAADREKPRAV